MLSVADITELVRQRKNQAARVAIRKALKSNSDPDLIFRACEWYWAMGLLREAFLLLRLSEEFPAPQSANSFDGRRLLWGARFLNNMGASLFALELASLVEPTNAEQHWILGNIYHSNRCNDEAVFHFQKMDELAEDRNGRNERFRLMVKASALAAVARFDEAIAIMRDVYERTSEPTLAGHMQMFWGAILAQAERFTEALPILIEAEQKLTYIQDLPDFGTLCKWMGLCYGKTGDLKKAEAYFSKSNQILFTTVHRFEPWLDLIHYQAQVFPVPELWTKSKIHYPGHTPGLQDYFGPKTSTWFGAETAPLRVDLESDEYCIAGRWRLGIPKELLLLAYLRIVGEWGINAVRVQSLLWPGEVFSFGQLTERLKKLIGRLRAHYKLEVLIKAGHVSLGEASLEQVAVCSGGVRRPSFLRMQSAFRSSDLEETYSVSKAQASFYLRKWIEDGLLERQGAGRNTRYVVQPEMNS